MRIVRILSVAIFLAIISGCANKPDIDNGDAFWQQKPKTIVVVTTKAAVPEYVDENADNKGLAMDVINLMLSQKLDKHLEQMDLNWYYQTLPQDFQKRLAKENIKVVIATEHPYAETASMFSKPRLDRNQLAAEYNAEQVLVFNLPFYGAVTPVGGLFSGTPPMEGMCMLNAELSDPQQSTVYWRHSSHVSKQIPLPVDQPPDFPNITQTIIASQHQAAEELLDSFVSGH